MPTIPANQNDVRVREAAYAIWESEGCPAGQEERHWQLALSSVATNPPEPKKKRAPAKVRRAA